MKTYWILVIILGVFNFNIKNASNQQIIRGSTKNDLIKTESLINLLEFVINNYLSACDLILVYDDEILIKYPKLFSNLFEKSSQFAIFIQSHLNNNSLINTYKCYNYIIILQEIYSIKQIIPKEIKKKILILTESATWMIKDYLKEYSSRLYVNILIISPSRNSEGGEYLLHTHELFADGSASTQPILLTSWMKNKLANKAINQLFPEKLSDGFRGHRFIIATASIPPYAIRTDIVAERRTEWDGIDIRTIKLLGKFLNFSAEFRDPETLSSPVYAVTNDVLTNKAQIGVGGVFNTLNIYSNFDTTYSYADDCAAFLTKSSLALPKYKAVMGPLQPSVWILVCLSYLIIIIPLTMNTNYTFLSLITRPARFMNMFWYIFSTFTNSFIVENPLLNTELTNNSISILIGVYWVFTIIITSCYTGSIMAFITVPTFTPTIDTVQQLLDEKYITGTLDHDGWEKWFNWTNIEDPTAAELLKSLQYISTIEQGIKNITEAFFWSYAFLGSRIILHHTIQQGFPISKTAVRPPMHVTKECLVNFHVTFILPKDSVYTEIFNKMILRIKQSGLSEKIIRDVEWNIHRTAEGLPLPVSNEYKHQKVIADGDRKLKLDDTQGIMLVFGAGIFIAILTLLIECCIHMLNKKKHHHNHHHIINASPVILKPWNLDRSGSETNPNYFTRSHSA